MSLLPDNASFHEKVEAAFVLYRGSGVSLSPNDVELVHAWAQLDVPFEVVARGLKRAAEAALWDAPDGEGRLRSLAGARRHVEAEIAKYLTRMPSPTAEARADDTPLPLARWKKLLSVLRKAGRDEPAVAWVASQLVTLDPPSDLSAAGRREELVLALLARRLPGDERSRLVRTARELTARGGALGRHARRDAFRFHRNALVRHHFALPAFW